MNVPAPKESKISPVSLVALLLIIAIAVWLERCQDDRARPPFGAPKGNATAEKWHEGPRKIYPYSVVPGGVYTVDEIRLARADAAVDEHYRYTLVPDEIKIWPHPEVWAYVSYRIGDNIYWSKRQVFVEDAYWADDTGEPTIRARCGNRMSLKPMLPVLDNEPPDVYSDEPLPVLPVVFPELEMQPLITLEPEEDRSFYMQGSELLPVLPYSFRPILLPNELDEMDRSQGLVWLGGSGGFGGWLLPISPAPAPVQVAPIPEPATWGMVGVGVGLVLFGLSRR